MANKIYRVEGPGGKIYRVEGPEGADHEQIIGALEEHLASLPPTPEPKRGVGASFMKGLEGLLSSGQTGIEASMMSPEEAARRGLERGERMGAEYADQTSLQAIKDAYQKQGLLPAAKELARQVPLALAEQAPQFAETIGGARVGAALGAPLGPYGAIAGGIGGAFVPSFIHQRGSDIERQAIEQQKRGQQLSIDLNKADIAAAKQAGLDVVGNFAAFGGKLVSKATGIPMPAMFGKSAAKAEKLANERLLTSLGKGTLRFGAVEMPTEIAQQMLERQQAGLSLTSPDAYEEYGQTAYQIGLLGPLGGVGRVMERGGARAEVAQRQAEEQAQQAQVAAEARRVEREKLMAQEDEAKRQEETFKASPEYATQLATRYDELKAKDAELLAAAQAKVDKSDPASLQAKKDAAKALREFRQSDEYNDTVKEYLRLGRPAAYTAAPEIAPTERPRGFAAEDYTKVKQPGEGVVEPAAPVPTPNVVDRMDELDAIDSRLDGIRAQRTALKEAGNTDGYVQLNQDIRKLEETRDALAKEIEEQGGVTSSPESFELESQKQLKALRDKIKKKKQAWFAADELEDKDVADKRALEYKSLTEQLTALEAKVEKQRELLNVKATPKNETVPMFPAEIAQPKTGEVVRPEEAGAGPLPPEDFRRRGKKQLALDLEPKPLATLTAPWQSAKERQEALAATPENETYPLFRDIPQRKRKEAAALEETPTPVESDKVKAKQAEVDAKVAELEAELKAGPAQDEAVSKRKTELTAQLNDVRQKYYDILEREDLDDDAKDKARESMRRRMNELEADVRNATVETSKTRHISELNKITDDLGKAYIELDALRNPSTETAEDKAKQSGLFERKNLIKTALANGDKYYADLMERAQKEADVREKRLKDKAFERETLLRGLETRFNLPGVVVQAIKRNSLTFAETKKGDVVPVHGDIESALHAINHRFNRIHSTTGTAKSSLTDRMEAAKEKMQTLQEKINGNKLTGQALTGAKKSLKAETKKYNEYKKDIGRLNKEINEIYKSLIKTTGTSQEAREEQRVETVRARKAKEGRARLAVPEIASQDRARFEKGLAEIEARISNDVADAMSDEEISNIEARGEIEKQEYYNRFRVEKTLSKEAKQARKGETAKGLKADPARVARELGEKTEEYRLEKEAAQVETDKVNAQYDKWNDGAKAKLAKIKASKGDISEAYKKAEASYVDEGNKRLKQRDEKLAKIDAQFNQLAEKIGRAQPNFRGALIKATNKRVERAAEGPIEQTQKSKRTVQETRKVAKLGRTATGSEESRAATAAQQARFEKKEAGAQAKERGQAFAAALQRATTSTKNTALQKAFEDARKSKLPPAFRTGEATGAVVDPAEARARIAVVKSRLPKDMDLTYVPDLEKISPELDKTLRDHGWDGKAFKGVVLPDGKIIVVGNTHTDMRDLEATLLHEMIGHYGIDTVIGIDKLTDFARDTDLEKLAKKIGGDELWREALAAMDFAVSQKGKPDLAALREIIAHTMEQRVNENFLAKAGRWLKELVGMVRSALRDMGFVDATNLSTNDVYYMLKQANDQFNNRKLGPYRNADGIMAFRSPTLPVSIASSFAVENKSWKDNFLGNVTGLAGRMQIVDKYAALDEVQRKGLEKGVINDLEAENGQYFLRFGDQVSQFATQALTTGPLQLKAQETKRGREYYYTTGDGATMMQVADAIAPSKIGNDAEKEAMLTALIAGERAKAVGWDKLNVSDPALAQAEYQQVVDALEASPRDKEMFYKAMDIYREYNAGLLDFMVQTGTMTKEKAAELKSKPYVPYYRVNQNTGDVDLFVDKETIMNVGNIKTEKELEALVGSNRRIQPIFTSAIQNTFLLTRMALRNKSVNETVLILDKLGMVSKMGTGSGPANASTVRYKYKGKDMFAVIDQDVYGVPADYVVRGLEGIKTTMPAIIQSLGIPADILRKFITRNPAYAVKQAVRDPLAAWFSTGMDGVPVLGSMQQLGKSVFGRNEDVEKLMRSGAVSSNVLTGDQRDMEKALREISTGKKGAFSLLAKADALAMQGDAATRAVIYRDSINKGMSEMQAMLRTLESMNFNRRGLSPSVYALSTLTPFLNAQIQGLDVLYRTLKNRMPFAKQLDLRSKLIRRGMLATASTIAYAMAMQDDDDYKNAKPEERYGNWFVKTPFSDEPVKIPIPFEFGFLFKALPEAVIDSALGDEKASRSVMGIYEIGKTYNPFGIPAAVKPGIELYLGKSFYGGDIETKREIQTMLPTDRYRPTTTEAAKLVGKVTGEVGLGSPIQLDYLIRGYTGPLGVALVQMTNPLLGGGKIEQPSSKESKLPIVGTLFQTTEPRAILDESYDRMLDIQQATGTYKRLVQEGRREDAKAFRDEYINRIAAASISGAAQQRLGEMAAMRRLVIDSPRLSQERKDELLEKIDKQRELYAKRFIQVTDRTRPPAAQP